MHSEAEQRAYRLGFLRANYPDGWSEEEDAAHGDAVFSNQMFDDLDSDYPPTSPSYGGADAGEDAVEAMRHKLWMVACHATGGNISEIKGIDRSVNDICVQISAHSNAVYEAGKEAGVKGKDYRYKTLIEWIDEARTVEPGVFIWLNKDGAWSVDSIGPVSPTRIDRCAGRCADLVC